MDLNHYPYPSRRQVVMGRRGVVATSQNLASVAGMEMLLRGGNAADAALAMAIALTVVEPTSNGIGSDAFALIWDGQLHGLNASGRSPFRLGLPQFAPHGQLPQRGWAPVTVPGAPGAWKEVHQRFGRLPFEQLFEPAIRWAEEGFPVSPETARAWQRTARSYAQISDPVHQPFRDLFFPGGRAPRPGDIWASPHHAATLREIAQSHTESFYRGKLAMAMAEFAGESGGFLDLPDLAAHKADWVQPIGRAYRGTTLWEIPPNGQGIAALMALGILEDLEIHRYPRESVDAIHLQVEAMKLAFADVQRYVADPQYMPITASEMLNGEYLAQRRSLITDQASLTQAGIPRGGTVYLCAADGELMVSFIQSNYMGFGSGIVVPDTGISLQNRGLGFSLEEGHPNQYAPGKRPFHTIIPGFLTRDGKPLGPFGVMGGHMQPQGHLQMVVNLVDYGLNPQAALDAPRWQWVEGLQVDLEASLPAHLVQGLAARGHQIRLQPEGGAFGRGQFVLRHGESLVGASEPRADGLALAW